RQVPVLLATCAGMIVPAEEDGPARLGSQGVDGDDGGSGLGQAAGQQTALPPQVPAVAVAQTRGFLAPVEGPRHRRAGGRPQRRGADLVGPFQHPTAINLAPKTVEGTQEPAPLAEPGRGDAPGECPARWRVTCGGRVARVESLVTEAKVDRAGHERLPGNAD